MKLGKINYEVFSGQDDFEKCVEALRDLYFHKKAQKGEKVDYDFSRKETYAQKNKLAHELVKKFAAKSSGIDLAEMDKLHPDVGAFASNSFTDRYFAVIERTIDSLNVKSELEEAMQFAEVQSLAEGDSGLFNVKGKGFIDFHKDANGKRNNVINKTYMESFTIVPENRTATISVSMYKIATGSEDLGDLINKVIQGQRTQMYTEVYDLMFDSSASSLNAIALNTLNQTNLMELSDKLTSLNHCTADQTYMFGTRLSLSKVLPESTDLIQGSTLGNTMMKEGYLANGGFGAFKMIPLTQGKRSQDPDANDFIIPTNYALMMCVAGASDKPVKIVTEGRTRTYTSKEGDTANNEIVRTISMKWNMKIVSAMHFGLVKTF